MQPFELKKRQLLAALIVQLETALREQKLWQSERPSEQALASCMPFAVDSLTFPQWLQFVFIEKITQLLQLNLALPTAMSITPMAEQCFTAETINRAEIIALITRIDLTINETQ